MLLDVQNTLSFILSQEMRYRKFDVHSDNKLFMKHHQFTQNIPQDIEI